MKVIEQILIFPVNALLFLAWLYLSIIAFIFMPIMAIKNTWPSVWKSFISARKNMWKHLYADYF